MVVLVGSKVAFSHMVFDISQNWGGLVWFMSYVSYYVGHPDVHEASHVDMYTKY